MNFTQKSNVFLAPLLWMSSIQYFIVTVVVAAAWSPAFNWRDNFTSSLGNTECGVQEGLYVCSPLFALMNFSFVVQGLLLFAGGVLFARAFREFKLAGVGFYLVALGGIGSIIVGLVPENTNLELHSLGALLPFFFGNFGALLVGLSKLLNGFMKWFTIASGAVALASFGLFISGVWLGIGQGGMERLTDYIQIVWVIMFGVWVWRKGRASKVVGSH